MQCACVRVCVFGCTWKKRNLLRQWWWWWCRWHHDDGVLLLLLGIIHTASREHNEAIKIVVDANAVGRAFN